MCAEQVKVPRKPTPSSKYVADVCGSGFQVAGPSLHDAYFSRKEDAEMVAASLNLAVSLRAIQTTGQKITELLEDLNNFR